MKIAANRNETSPFAVLEATHVMGVDRSGLYLYVKVNAHHRASNKQLRLPCSSGRVCVNAGCLGEGAGGGGGGGGVRPCALVNCSRRGIVDDIAWGHFQSSAVDRAAQVMISFGNTHVQ